MDFQKLPEQSTTKAPVNGEKNVLASAYPSMIFYNLVIW